MNYALLGKHAWKVIRNPNSIVAKTMLPKYTRNKSFINAGHRSSDSWVWKSLMTGKEIYKQGLEVQVWNGQNSSIVNGTIQMFDDNSSNSITKLCGMFSHTTCKW